jgi:hypothetical protein
MDERILMEGICNPLSKRGFATKNGRGILTNKRFIFCKHSIAKVLAIGALVNLTEGEYEYDILAENVVSAETKRHMLGKALFITTRDGVTRGYGITKSEHWNIALGNFTKNK